MQGPLIELEYFRELLKYFGAMAYLKFRFGSRHPAPQVFPGRFSACLFRFISVQCKPILFFILPWTAMPPSLTHSPYFPAVKQVINRISCSVKFFYR
jgi:hypothetical protein